MKKLLAAAIGFGLLLSATAALAWPAHGHPFPPTRRFQEVTIRVDHLCPVLVQYGEPGQYVCGDK